ncbi:replicative DNA helicase [Flexistipes sp.]|uniref:replicative DNA helicase n=1 Tax=Flexistipes sp. TaxID=3088135 RepID=UPI002E1D8A2F|nr:replicative DNA helicase [Flexistipes sp.]
MANGYTKNYRNNTAYSDNNSPAIKKPPYSMEAEQAVLASILIDDKALDKIVHLLGVSDFYYPPHKIIFKELMELAHNNKPLDIVTLVSSLNDKELTEKAGGVDYISELVNIIPNSANIVHYANMVKDKALLRALIEFSSDIAEKSYSYTGEISSLVDEAEKHIFSLAEFKLKNEVQPIGVVIKDTFEILESLYGRNEQITGIPTGFMDLDRLTNGLQKSDLIIVAGRPGMGKTAFAMNLALNTCSKYDRSAAVFSLEMSSGQLVQRLLSSEAKIESTKLRNGRLNNDEWQRLASVGSELNDLNLFLDDTPAISSMELRAKCRRLKREYDLDVVIVDYLQLMSGSRAESREQQISEISRALKALAKELNIPVIALSQLNRGVENRTDKRPVPSDLRESGAIEQDADLIMFLYRDEVYHQDTKLPGVAELIVAKHRNGPTDTIKLAFLEEYTRFENAEL